MKRHVLPAAAILVVTLLLPWLAVTFVSGDAGMAACFLLFFAVNPLLAIGVGIAARQWWWPVIVAGMFLVGAWLLFAPGETAFLLYAGIYLALGWAAMALKRLIRKSSKERD